VKSPNGWRKELATAIREARARADMKAEKLAECAGVSPAMIYNYENGTHSPKADVLSRICRAVGKIEFPIDGKMMVVACQDSLLKPRSVPRQLRLEIGIACDPKHASIKPVKSSDGKNSVVLRAVVSG
jgi:transcriptional regulator with XRE-family HTH domain